MKGTENKADIIYNFEPVLKHTRAGEDVEYINYGIRENGDEFVAVYFAPQVGGVGAYKEIDVTADSGAAMIIDVLRALM